MIVGCPACHKKNRISLSRLPKTGHCGACKEPFGQLAVPIDVDVRSFDEVLKTCALPVLVDFWAPWCGPCLSVADEVKEAARQLAGKAVVLKVDTEKHPELSQRYEIRGIPYFAVFRNGAKVGEQVGVVDRRALVALATS